MLNYTNISINFPLLEKAIEKWGGLSLFKKYFGFFSYLQNLVGVVEGFQKTEYIRGPVQLDEVYAIKSEDKGKTKTPIRGEIANITIDTNALYQQLKKQK